MLPVVHCISCQAHMLCPLTCQPLHSTSWCIYSPLTRMLIKTRLEVGSSRNLWWYTKFCYTSPHDVESAALAHLQPNAAVQNVRKTGAMVPDAAPVLKSAYLMHTRQKQSHGGKHPRDLLRVSVRHKMVLLLIQQQLVKLSSNFGVCLHP